MTHKYKYTNEGLKEPVRSFDETFSGYKLLLEHQWGGIKPKTKEQYPGG